ncbi:MAG: Dabb family protein [Vicinamibacterales bacterium]
MVAHVVLFRPKPDLPDLERIAFIDALEHALVSIPLIKRARVGRRLTFGRAYDEQNSEQFPYAAILEFEKEADLRQYLDHPAHERLGEQFYHASERALVFDFDLKDHASELFP